MWLLCDYAYLHLGISQHNLSYNRNSEVKMKDQ